MGSHSVLQRIFLTQGSNSHLLCFLHCGQILYHLSHQGAPLLFISFIYSKNLESFLKNWDDSAKQSPWRHFALFLSFHDFSYQKTTLKRLKHVKRCLSTSTIIFKMLIKAKRSPPSHNQSSWKRWGKEGLLISCTGEYVRKWSPSQHMDFPNGSVGEESSCNTGDTGDVGLILGSGRFPWRKKWQPLSVFLPEKSHGQSSLVGYSPNGCKELDMTEQLNTQHM